MNTLGTMVAAPRPQAETAGLRSGTDLADTRQGGSGLFGAVLGALAEPAPTDFTVASKSDPLAGEATAETRVSLEEPDPMALLAAVAGAEPQPSGKARATARDTLFTLVARALPDGGAVPQVRSARSASDLVLSVSASPDEPARSEAPPPDVSAAAGTGSGLPVLAMPSPAPAVAGLVSPTPMADSTVRAGGDEPSPQTVTAKLPPDPGAGSDLPLPAGPTRSVQAVSEPRLRIAVLAQETHFAPVTPRLARSAATGFEPASVPPRMPVAAAPTPAGSALSASPVTGDPIPASTPLGSGGPAPATSSTDDGAAAPLRAEAAPIGAIKPPTVPSSERATPEAPMPVLADVAPVPTLPPVPASTGGVAPQDVRPDAATPALLGDPGTADVISDSNSALPPPVLHPRDVSAPSGGATPEAPMPVFADVAPVPALSTDPASRAASPAVPLEASVDAGLPGRPAIPVASLPLEAAEPSTLPPSASRPADASVRPVPLTLVAPAPLSQPVVAPAAMGSVPPEPIRPQITGSAITPAFPLPGGAGSGPASVKAGRGADVVPPVSGSRIVPAPAQSQTKSEAVVAERPVSLQAHGEVPSAPQPSSRTVPIEPGLSASAAEAVETPHAATASAPLARSPAALELPGSVASVIPPIAPFTAVSDAAAPLAPAPSIDPPRAAPGYDRTNPPLFDTVQDDDGRAEALLDFSATPHSAPPNARPPVLDAARNGPTAHQAEVAASPGRPATPVVLPSLGPVSESVTAPSPTTPVMDVALAAPSGARAAEPVVALSVGPAGDLPAPTASALHARPTTSSAATGLTVAAPVSDIPARIETAFDARSAAPAVAQPAEYRSVARPLPEGAVPSDQSVRPEIHEIAASPAVPRTSRAAELASPGETAAAPMTVAGEPARLDPVVPPAPASTPVAGPARQVAEAVTAALPPPAVTQPGRLEADSPLRVLTLQLRPLDLGTILVRMRLRGGQLEMNLHASREETAALLRQDGELLAGLLRGAGYQPEAVTIGSGPQETFTPTGAGPGFQPGDGQQNAQGRSLSGEPERRPTPAHAAESQDTRERTNETNPAGDDRNGVYL